MQEMNKIDTFVDKIHTKFMNKPRTPKESMVADLVFSANLMKMAIANLKRWSHTTNKPKTAWKEILKKIIKEEQ